MNRKKIRVDVCNHKQCFEDNGCLKTCCQQKYCSGRITASPDSSTAVLYQHRASVPFCGDDTPKYYTAPDNASNIDPDDKAILEYLTVGCLHGVRRKWNTL